jgi:DNA helicase II / ATP-dependent DNA helicase PcrA
MSDNLLENLNKEQLEAVTFGEGPLMIIAGAGTGKTTVITQRIAWLIEQGRVKPDEILALTFTEKAATEMEERVDRLLPIGYVDLWISTFHAFCEKILRAHALEIGLPHEFKLVNEVDALLLLRRNFHTFNLDYYRPRGNPTKFIKALLTHFSRLKDETITPEEYLEYVDKLQMEADTAEGVASKDEGEKLAEIARLRELANAYHQYQQLLLQEHALDFADLIFYCLELLQKRPNIRKIYQKQFKYILVDEFQDTNHAQYELVKQLCSGSNNITIVGDDDQSIYKFRGASLSNILKFREHFPKAQGIVLNKNYRSRGEILHHAYELIQKNNPDRLEIKEELNKKLETQTKEKGVVEFIECETGDDEVKCCIEKIINLQKKDAMPWSDFCILVRANDSAKPFITMMDRIGIPYRFLAMSGLYTKPIILDILAFMRVVDQPHESTAVYRILSHPQIGIPEFDVQQLALYCRRKSKSLIGAMKDASFIHQISMDGKMRIQELLNTFSAFSRDARRLPASELFVKIMKESGLLAQVRLQNEAVQQEEFGYLQQFFERLKKFEETNDDKTLHHFLEEYTHERDAGEVGSLAKDVESGPDVVNIMTVHASKGLEFPYVFIANLVEQRFPSQRRSDPITIPDELIKDKPEGEGDQHIQEERRLFYVAMTRAKQGLFLFSAKDYGGTRKRKTSRFVQELELNPKIGKTDSNFRETDKIESKKSDKAMYQEPKSISFTQIAAFTSCPLQYKFAHILKVPVFGRHSLSFGKTMHNTLQKFMELVLRQQQGPQASLFDPKGKKTIELPDKKEMLALYETCWIDEWYPSEQLRSEYHKKGEESLSEYYQMLKKDLPEIAWLEKGFTLKIAGVTVRGRIDRIDKIKDGYEIIDYKTGKPKDKLAWQEKRQLVLYQLAGEQCFDPPISVKKLTYHYLEDNSMVSFECTEKDKEKLEQEILSTVDAIKQSDFAPTPGFQCQYCDFKDICEFSKS